MTSPSMKSRLARTWFTMTVLSAGTLLSGCVMAAPSAFQLATYAADGASYAATGKSVTDHLISEVTAKDCALMRGLKGEDICSEIEPERMPDGTLVPNARDAALGVRPAESDAEFQSFAIATAAKGDSDDEVLDTPDALSQSFAQPPEQTPALGTPQVPVEGSGPEIRLAAAPSNPIAPAVRAKAAPSVPVYSDSAPPPREERLAQDTASPQVPEAEPTEPAAELDLPEEEDIAPPRDFQLDDDEDEILDLSDIQELERTHAPGASAR